MSTHFADVVQRMNSSDHLRTPGSSPPEVCEVYRDADQEGKILVNAILGFEIAHQRRVRPDDEPAVMEKVGTMKRLAAMANETQSP